MYLYLHLLLTSDSLEVQHLIYEAKNYYLHLPLPEAWVWQSSAMTQVEELGHQRPNARGWWLR